MFPEKDPFDGFSMVCERKQENYKSVQFSEEDKPFCDYVDDTFDLILNDLDVFRDVVKTQINDELKKYDYFGETKHLFNEQFLVCNHMVKCYFKGEEDNLTLPLIDFRKEIKNSFISPWSFPSLLIFNEDNPCVANLSPTGIMNITGGYNLHQLKDSIKFYSLKVIKFMEKHKGTRVKLVDIHFKIRYSSNKVGGKTFDCVAINDFCFKNGITTAVYDPNRINRIQIFPFPKTLPSVAVNIFPSGGVNIYGFKAFYEVDFVVKMLKSWLWRFVCPDSDFKGWEIYNNKRSREESVRLDKSLLKKKAKIQHWEEKIGAMEKRNIYEAWSLTEDDPECRRFLRCKLKEEKNEIKDLKKRFKKDKNLLHNKIQVVEKSRENYIDMIKTYREENGLKSIN